MRHHIFQGFTFAILMTALSIAGCGNTKETGENVPSAEAASVTPAPESPTPAPAAAVKNGFDGMPAPGTTAYCPVMKQSFKVTADSTFSVHKGKTYVFCCPGCKPQFEADPEKTIANL